MESNQQNISNKFNEDDSMAAANTILGEVGSHLVNNGSQELDGSGIQPQDAPLQLNQNLVSFSLHFHLFIGECCWREAHYRFIRLFPAEGCRHH